MHAGLAVEKAPAFSVPVRFFLTGPLFGVAAAMVLLWNGPGTLAERWSPTALALTHFMTLGYLALTMVGAMTQMLAVLGGSPVPRSRGVGRLTHILLVAGTLLLTGGFLSGEEWMFRPAVIILLAGLGLFSLFVVWSLWHGRSKHPSIYGMSLALGALIITILLGAHLGAAYGWLAPIPRAVTDIHAMWGLLGWIGLLVISVAFQVVPMFQITPDYPAWLTRWLVTLLFLGLAAWSVLGWPPLAGEFPSGTAVRLVIAALIGLGLALFAALTLALQRRRKRKLKDVTLWYWQVAMASLLACVALWIGGQISGDVSQAPAYEITLAAVFLVGFGVSVVNGMLYKIVPFLVWLHTSKYLHSKGLSSIIAPNMKQVIPDTAMRRQFWLHVLALVLILLSIYWPYPWAHLAGLSFAVASLALWWNMLGAVQVYRRFLKAH